MKGLHFSCSMHAVLLGWLRIWHVAARLKHMHSSRHSVHKRHARAYQAAFLGWKGWGRGDGWGRAGACGLRLQRCLHVPGVPAGTIRSSQIDHVKIAIHLQVMISKKDQICHMSITY